MELNEAAALARETMDKHGLRYIKFEWHSSKTIFGLAYGVGKLSLSKQLTLANTKERVLETILHEVAHLLVGVHNRHNWRWQNKMIELGLEPKRCFNTDDTEMPKAKYYRVCKNCGRKRPLYRKSNAIRACTPCCDRYNYGRFSENYILTLVAASELE